MRINGLLYTGWRTIPVLLDLDLDGKRDLILGGWYSDVRFYTNTGTNANPIFTTFIYLVTPDSTGFTNGNPPRVNFTDWDGDADLDMITCDYYGSVFLRRNISGTGLSENSHRPASAGLRITPNPVSNRAVFDCWLAASGTVRIDVYTPDGRHVATPFYGSAAAGRFTASWNAGCELPNGVYLAVLNTGTVTHTRQLLLVR